MPRTMTLEVHWWAGCLGLLGKWSVVTNGAGLCGLRRGPAGWGCRDLRARWARLYSSGVSLETRVNRAAAGTA